MPIDSAETLKLWATLAVPSVALLAIFLNYVLGRRLQSAIELQKAQLQKELHLQIEAKKADLQRDLQLQVEAHKAQVQLSSQKELEQVRAELQRLAFEHQTRFVRLHEKRVTATTALYEKLAKVHRMLGKEFGRLSSTTPDDSVLNAVNEALKLYSEAEDTFRDQEILFDPDVASSISNALREAWAPMVAEAVLAVGPKGRTPEEATKAKKAWLDNRHKAAPVAQSAMTALQQQFRRFLGSMPSSGNPAAVQENPQ